MGFRINFLIINVLIALTLTSGVASAAEAEKFKSCVCQTGTTPMWQIPAFKLGCSIWLSQRQGCDYKSIETKPESYTNNDAPVSLPIEAQDGLLEIGYVGHWTDSFQSYMYLLKNVADTQKKYNLDVFVDNTACAGSDTFTYLMGLFKNEGSLPVNKTLRYRSNQNTSIGIWDSVIGRNKMNLWAEVIYPNPQLKLPSCREFENHYCMRWKTKSDGKCLSANQEIKTISCEVQNAENTYGDGNSSSEYRWKVME